MPGIFGLAAPDPKTSRFREVIRESHAIPGLQFLETAYEFESSVFVSLARVDESRLSSTISYDPKTRVVLLLEGEIYNGAGYRERYPNAGSSVADALLREYLSDGPAFIESVDGEFNIAVFEPSESRIDIFSDHVGSYPLYYWHHGSEFLFGSEKKCVLAASKREPLLDPIGLLQPFVHQHNLEERTLIQGLCRLRPATRLSYMSGRLTQHSYGRNFGKVCIRGNSAELLEAWTVALKTATSKRLAGKAKLLISLSAGLDSRAIACAIDRDKRPIHARTAGHVESLEVRYAAMISRLLNFEHHVENPLDFYYSDVVRRIVWRTDGETDFRNGLSMFTHGSMRLLANDVIGGWLGDISSGSHLRPFMFVPAGRAAFINKLFRWYIQHDFDDLTHVFAADFLNRHWPEVKQAFAQSYEPFKDLPNPSAHEMWDLRNRQTRMTVSSMPVDSHLFGKVRPFFDRTYLDFVSGIPVRWRVGQSLYKSLISSIGPEIRSIPNGNTGVRNYQSLTANLFGYGRTIGDKILAKIARRLPARRREALKGRLSSELAAHQRRDPGLRRLIEEFLGSGDFDGRIFNRRGIVDMLDRHYGGVRDHGELVAILATYATALQYFVYGRSLSCPKEAEPIL